MAEHHADQLTETFEAAASLVNQLYHFVALSDGVRQVNMASLKTWTGNVGILVNAPAAAGRHATVQYGGRGKVTAGAAVASVGVFLSTNGSGRAVASGSGDMVMGTALETAAADGDLISIQACKPWRLSGAV